MDKIQKNSTFFRETFPKSTHWNWKEITEIPNVFVSYFAPLVTNLTTNWLRLLPCQRMLTQVYFLWWESGGENESKRFCFRAICCQCASADSLLFVKYPFLFNSFNFPTQLISFYYLFVMLFLSFIRSLAMLVTH